MATVYFRQRSLLTGLRHSLSPMASFLRIPISCFFRVLNIGQRISNSCTKPNWRDSQRMPVVVMTRVSMNKRSWVCCGLEWAATTQGDVGWRSRERRSVGSRRYPISPKSEKGLSRLIKYGEVSVGLKQRGNDRERFKCRSELIRRG